ncbi:hypothetical protein [Nannocystis radixulma]|uniref:hypothetical protein n=1 Tax=Nannocystis radixulma TaxID=2995305 RepID=UPI00358DBB83
MIVERDQQRRVEGEPESVALDALDLGAAQDDRAGRTGGDVGGDRRAEREVEDVFRRDHRVVAPAPPRHLARTDHGASRAVGIDVRELRLASPAGRSLVVLAVGGGERDDGARQRRAVVEDDLHPEDGAPGLRRGSVGRVAGLPRRSEAGTVPAGAGFVEFDEDEAPADEAIGESFDGAFAIPPVHGGTLDERAEVAGAIRVVVRGAQQGDGLEARQATDPHASAPRRPRPPRVEFAAPGGGAPRDLVPREEVPATTPRADRYLAGGGGHAARRRYAVSGREGYLFVIAPGQVDNLATTSSSSRVTPVSFRAREVGA